MRKTVIMMMIMKKRMGRMQVKVHPTPRKKIMRMGMIMRTTLNLEMRVGVRGEIY